MSLSDPKVLETLKRDFVVGWTNISGKADYAGTSGTHRPGFPAATPTNGAGHHNVQIFLLHRDGKVLHCLPGFWQPDELRAELALARSLDQLAATELSPAVKNQRFLDAQLAHALEHDRRTQTDSELQHFDKKNLESRESTDFTREEWMPKTCLKTTDQVVHERMAERPFVAFADFDTATFIDMGTKSYDAHCDGCAEHGKKTTEDPESPATPDETRARPRARERRAAERDSEHEPEDRPAR